MTDITAIILTKDEEKNIEKCIHSIQGLACRIIVVDSYSTDRTTEIAKNMGAEIFSNPFINYATQFNWALLNANITTQWVLRIDADEELLPETVTEIISKTKEHQDSEINGFILKTRIFFMGKWIKHGGIYPLRILRIFKYGKAVIENRNMDEHTVLTSGTAIELDNDLLHYDFKSLNHWTAKHNWYSNREVMDFFENQKKKDELSNSQSKFKRIMKNKFYYNMPLFIRPFIYFCLRYFFQLGFLDGKEGLIFHFLQGFWYRFLVDAKIYECMKTGEMIDATGDLTVKENIAQYGIRK